MAKKTSASAKAQLAAYKSDNRFVKNKIAKLERHLKNYPNDEIAQAALKSAPNAKSSRFGKKAYKSTRSHLDRITDPIYAQIRKSNRVYATVKDGEALVLNGVLFSGEKLREVFGVKATEKHKPASKQAEKPKQARRGKRKPAKV